MKISHNNLLKILAICLFTGFISCTQEATTNSNSAQGNSSNETGQKASYDWVKEDLKAKWKNNQEYTIQVLEAMPEEAYDFVPSEGMMSFRQQAAHITKTINWQLQAIGSDSLPVIDTTSKEQIISSYQTLFESLNTYLDGMDSEILSDTTSLFFGNTTKNRIFYLLDNHVAHHRGQMIVYLRLQGIEPPRYRGW